MTDQIELRGLRVTTIVGVNPEEAIARSHSSSTWT